MGRLVARISVDTQTVQTDRTTTVTLAAHARRGLTRPYPLALFIYLGGSGSHNEWHVSTPACYLLLTSQCQTLRELTSVET